MKPVGTWNRIVKAGKLKSLEGCLRFDVLKWWAAVVQADTNVESQIRASTDSKPTPETGSQIMRVNWRAVHPGTLGTRMPNSLLTE